MTSTQPYQELLKLGAGASEKDIRRAYARVLKTLDLQEQPEAFNELRSTYERLMNLARSAPEDAEEKRSASRSSMSGTPEHGLVNPPAPIFSFSYKLNDSLARTHTNPGKSEDRPASQSSSRDTDSQQEEHRQSGQHVEHVEDAASTGTRSRRGVRNAQSGSPRVANAVDVTVPAHLMRRPTVLESMKELLRKRPVESQKDARDRLIGALNDPHLESLDARKDFEVGIVFLLASGWQPGHEFVFAAAMECFGWADKSLWLRKLGDSGEVLDLAIVERSLFRSQPAKFQERRERVIQTSRSTQRPSNGELFFGVPMLEELQTRFGNWMHIVARTQALTDWRNWEEEALKELRGPDWRPSDPRPPRQEVRLPQSEPPSKWSQSLQIFKGVVALLYLLFVVSVVFWFVIGVLNA